MSADTRSRTGSRRRTSRAVRGPGRVGGGRARPGREAEYSAYIRDFAEPIDEEARRAGVFEEVRTYTPFLRTGAPGADWTHMRVFKLKDFSALDGFSAGLDAAMERRFPDPGQRPSSAGLRDLVRQEIWRDF